MSPRDPDVPLRHSRHLRWLLSAGFGFHFLAVAVYLLPAESDTWDQVPEPIREPAMAVAVPVVYNMTPLSRPWLNAIWGRQNWRLFAPWPSSWNVSAEMTAWFPVDSTAVAPEQRWRADTIPIQSGESDPYPHIGNGRVHRLALHLGEVPSTSSYQVWLASSYCASLRDDGGRAPEGLEFRVNWTLIATPWGEQQEPPVQQLVGGFNCWELAGQPRPWWSRPVLDTLGLPGYLRSQWRSDPS